MKKHSRIEKPAPINITPEKIEEIHTFKEGGEDIYLADLKKFGEIEQLLEKFCSENPLDPEKTKKWMKASIKLKEAGTYVQVKPMVYSPLDRKEFTIQINELLKMKLIEPSNSPFMSPAFLVENEAERRRGKKRMVINYKKVNDLTS